MRILLVKLNHIGDTLLMTPTIKHIKESFPNARIDVVVRKGCEGVLEGNEHIEEIFTIAKPEKKNRKFGESLKELYKVSKALISKKYDWAFDLSNSDRAKLLILLSGAKYRGINRWNANLGFKKYLFNRFSDYAWGKNHQVLKDFKTIQEIMQTSGEAGTLHINLEGIDNALLQRFDLSPSKYIVIHPTSRWSFKEWSIFKWREVGNYFIQKGYKVVVTCGPSKRETEYAEKIVKNIENAFSTNGKTTLKELAFLIKNAKLFLGIDTAAMHIAAAVQTPVVALFGPTDEWSWHPWKVEHRLALGECPCKIARKITCDKSKILPCMESIEVNEVISAAEELTR